MATLFSEVDIGTLNGFGSLTFDGTSNLNVNTPLVSVNNGFNSLALSSVPGNAFVTGQQVTTALTGMLTCTKNTVNEGTNQIMVYTIYVQGPGDTSPVPWCIFTPPLT